MSTLLVDFRLTPTPQHIARFEIIESEDFSGMRRKIREHFGEVRRQVDIV